jgi:hypothetical protein
LEIPLEAATAESVRRTRKPTTVLVEAIKPGQQGWTNATKDGASFDETLDAEKWIRTNGENGVQYRIIRLVSTHKVKIETVRKAVLE